MSQRRHKMEVPPSGATAQTVVELSRNLDYFQALTHCAKLLTRQLKVKEVLDALMQSVSQLIEPKDWSLLLIDETTGELRFEIAVGAAAESLKNMRLAVGEGLAGWVAQHGQPLVVPKVADDPRFCSRIDEMTDFNTSSVLCVPLISHNRVLGVIELVRHESERAPFDADDLMLLEPFADFAAIAIENARAFQKIEELTLNDEWTSLYNARFLKQNLADEVTRAQRYGHMISIIFFDLDGFKAVNDVHGHTIGSALLQQVGDLMRRTIRETDRPVRYGGDEFVVIMPETDKAGAIDMAWRLRDALAGVALTDRAVTLTASFGVATFPDDASSSALLIEAADQAMYQAKALGKNTVADPKGAAAQHP